MQRGLTSFHEHRVSFNNKNNASASEVTAMDINQLQTDNDNQTSNLGGNDHNLNFGSNFSNTKNDLALRPRANTGSKKAINTKINMSINQGKNSSTNISPKNVSDLAHLFSVPNNPNYFKPQVTNLASGRSHEVHPSAHQNHHNDGTQLPSHYQIQ